MKRTILLFAVAGLAGAQEPDVVRQRALEAAIAGAVASEARVEVESAVRTEMSLAFDGFRYNWSTPMLTQPFALQARGWQAGSGREDADYRAGQGALDERQWENAVSRFDRVIAARGQRSDGALYWKAYALNKLGRREDALAALARLQKEHSQSSWIADAKALEIDVKQSSGQPVSPEQESDEELKIYAINSLVHTEPERALPLLERILTTSTSPKLKDRALFVLAQTRTPRATEILTKMAKGGTNPDLRVRAVKYLGDHGDKSVLPLMTEIYSSTNDVALRRVILLTYMRHKERDRLVEAAGADSPEQLRRDATQFLGNLGAYDELMKLYDAAQGTQAKSWVIHALHGRDAQPRLVELLKREREPRLRADIVRMLGNHPPADTGALLGSLYASESDEALRKALIESLANQNNAPVLVGLARKESDVRMKKHMIQHLSRMRSKEASDYLFEILSKP